MLCLVVLVFAVFVAGIVTGSIGEKAYVFLNCFESCVAENCSAKAPPFFIPIHLKLLQWSCTDECRYFCIWPAVEWFQNVGYGIPQFFGKWPHVRLGGIEQPASALFSLLNLVSHVIMLILFRKQVSKNSPLYYITHVYCFVHSHAWIWSSAFHIRNLWATEFMDYTSALISVLFSIFHFMARLVVNSRKKNLKLISLGLLLFVYFIYHCFAKFYIKMDYKYNLVFNIGVCVLNFIAWTAWCVIRFKQQPYVKLCFAYFILMAATTSFEMVDFPPLLWVFDAHSFWHLCTPWLTVIWYKFLMDDCRYMHKQRLATLSLRISRSATVDS